MKLIAVARSLQVRTTLPKIIGGSSQVRFFQPDFVSQRSKCQAKKIHFMISIWSTPPPSDKIIQLAQKIAALAVAERCQIGPTLTERLRHPKLQKISVEGGLDMGQLQDLQREETKEKTAFDVKLEKFDAAANIKVIKEVRSFTNLGLKEAKDLVEKVSAILKQGVTKEEANAIIEKIKAAGGVTIME